MSEFDFEIEVKTQLLILGRTQSVKTIKSHCLPSDHTPYKIIVSFADIKT